MAELQSYFVPRIFKTGSSEQSIVKPGCGFFLQSGFVPSGSMSIGGKRCLTASAASNWLSGARTSPYVSSAWEKLLAMLSGRQKHFVHRDAISDR